MARADEGLAAEVNTVTSRSSTMPTTSPIADRSREDSGGGRLFCFTTWSIRCPDRAAFGRWLFICSIRGIVEICLTPIFWNGLIVLMLTRYSLHRRRMMLGVTSFSGLPRSMCRVEAIIGTLPFVQLSRPLAMHLERGGKCDLPARRYLCFWVPPG